MTTRIAATMLAVILVVAVIALAGIAVDLLDLERPPLAIVALLLLAAAGAAPVVRTWRRAPRA